MIGKVNRSANFHRIAKYIFGKPKAEPLMESVPEGKTVAEKAEAMQFVASRNHRVKRPAYHLSLSPAESDDLSRTDWLLFCDRLLDELGLSNHQVLVGLHHDVKYPNSEKTRTHAHLLINLVNDEGKCASTSWDYYKIPKVLRHLERCYGLQSVPDVGETQRQRDSAGQYRLEQRSVGEQVDSTPVVHRSVRRKLQDIIDEVLKHSGSFEELSAAMESLGVQVHSTPQGWWMQYEGFNFAGYQLGRAYTQPAVMKRLEVERMTNMEAENSEVKHEQPVASMQEVLLSGSESESEQSEKPDLNPESQESVEVEVAIANPDLNPDLEQIVLAVQDSPVAQTPNSEASSDFQAEERSPSSHSPDWIEQLKRQAHQLERTELIDGKFYTGLAMDVAAHLAELGEVGKEVLQSFQQGDPEPDSTPDPEAVAESLSQFIQVRAAAHDLNPSEPIATNLGTLRFDPNESTVSITRNITVAEWDENAQEWQIPQELAVEHRDPVTQLLNNEAVGIEGYKFSGDDTERRVMFEQVRFQATQSDEGWQVTENQLSEDEQQRILNLPQSEQEYSRSTNGKDLINYFQSHAPEQFEGDVGVINWTAENGEFDRRFEVSVQPDDSRLVEGFDLKQADDWGNPRKVFSASISPDSSIQCSQCEIPNQDIDKLLEQERSLPPPETEPERERSHNQLSR